MKLRPFSTWRQENKELLVFLAIAFALPFLWFLVPAIFSLTGNSLHSLSSFSLFNVLCPAAGAMVVSLSIEQKIPCYPEPFFRRFLGLTAIVGACGSMQDFFSLNIFCLRSLPSCTLRLSCHYRLLSGRTVGLTCRLRPNWQAMDFIRCSAASVFGATRGTSCGKQPDHRYSPSCLHSRFFLLSVPSSALFLPPIFQFLWRRVRLADLSSAGIADEIGANPRRLALWGPVGPLAPSLQLVI